MTEYAAIRFALGVAQLAVAWLVWRRSVGYCFNLMVLMVAGGVFCIAPAYPNNEDWKQWVQVPSFAVLIGLTVAASVEVFAFLRRRTFSRERWLILAASSCISGAVVVAGWAWQPENWYQAFMLARQYALIALCVGYIASWVWVTSGRPVRMCNRLGEHGTLWCVWLVCVAVLSTTTKGGIWWSFYEWKGGEDVWRMTADMVMMAQIGVCAGLALNLQRWRGGLQVVRCGYRNRPTSLPCDPAIHE